MNRAKRLYLLLGVLVAVCAAGAVAFVALYALTLRVYARRAAKRGDD